MSQWQYRWTRFRENKTALWAVFVLLFVCVLSLSATFIANDKPLIIRYKNKLYFPVFTSYTDQQFGGSLPTEADYADPFTQEEIRRHGWYVMPPIPYSYDTIDLQSSLPSPQAPSLRHYLGTDDVARDVLARLLYGLRISLVFALALTLVSSAIGFIVGAIQGYFGGYVDLFLGRVLEIWGSLPQLFILIILASLFAPGFWTLLFVLCLFGWTNLVGVVRAEFLRVRNFEYVRAARALGASHVRVMVKHILPNALVSALTYIPFIFAGAIVSLTALDFLGFGLPAGSASLGDLVRQGKENLHALWIGLTAFFALTLVLSCLLFIGEGVRDAFDPRKDER